MPWPEESSIMREAAKFLNAWIESVRDYAIFLVDRRGSVASWNAGAERILGYGEAEILGRPAALLFTPEDRARGAPEWEMREALRVGRASNDRWHLRKDGSRLWCSGVITLLKDEAGEPSLFVKSMRDMTERKYLEEELRRRADELQEADRHKNEFLATLSHELRNPLAPISNALYILRHGDEVYDEAEVEQATEMIERQVALIKRLVDDLMDVSRVATRKVRLQVERFPLGHVLAAAAEAVKPLVAERRHQLTVRIDTEPILIEADATRLEQVIVNLLTNAAKYTDPGGSIVLTGAREGAEAVIRVRDDGIGIASDLLPDVFDLFRQAEHSLDRTRGGLGIGLALARSLVELHGGTIRADSEGIGEGTEFTVRLPVLARAKEPDERGGGAVATPEISPLRVLVVEDNADAARSLGMLLRGAGHAVYLAHDGPTALAMVRLHSPDLVLLDIGLPGMSGYEVAREIKAGGPLPVIAMTGYVREADAASDFDEYLVKPVNPDGLLSLLATYRRT
jgi:PAS domain S-box-containing protein